MAIQKKMLVWKTTYANLLKRKIAVEKDAGVKIPMTRWLHYLSTKPIEITIPIKNLARRKYKLDNVIRY